tara:strand:- start:93 stop:494 length:402 start_codon:yes stop_codon:yes gene_type:complete
MEKIAMKCTRAEYESIKDIIGKIKNPSHEDFTKYNYLLNYSDGGVQMYDNSMGHREVYETFDKAIFLKACGIKVNKDKRKKMFKKTIKLLKSFDELNFDINTVDIEYGYFTNAEGEHERDGGFTITIKGNKTK